MRQSKDQLVGRFLADLQREEVSAQTIRAYRFDLSHFGHWFLSSTGEVFAPPVVTPTDLRDYKAHLQTVERRSPATINRHLAALRRFFSWAQARGLIAAEQPTDRLRGVPSSPRSPKALDKREVDRLIRAVERGGSRRDLAIMQTLRHTGLRVGELTSLALADVELSERKGHLVVRSGKGGKYRVLPLNVDVRRALGDYVKVRRETSTKLLFVGQRGAGLKPRAVELLVAKYARLANLDDVSPHTLRHCFGKHLVDEGVNLVTVQRLLGHERLETVAIYTTPSQRDLERAVDRLSASPYS